MKTIKEITHLDGHEVPLSHRDKVLFPKSRLTKGDLLTYYAGIARTMVPLIQDHPLMLQRFPNGIQRPGFIQQEASEYFPDWLERVSVPKEGGRIDHVLANDAAALVYLANQNTIAFHMWQSRADRLNHPDRMVFDLDPSQDDFRLVCATAKSFRLLLQQLGLPAFAMTTGSRGLHVVVPLDRSEPFDPVRVFARELGDWMARQLPDDLTTEQRIAKRGSRLFLDPLRNTYAHTAIAPYSARAKEGAPVATPLAWEELDDPRLRSQTYSIKNIFNRLHRHADPWRGFRKQAVSLRGARQRFAKIADRRLA